MNPSTADTWVVVSAVTVGGVYAYLTVKGTEKTPLTEFATAWGVVYFIIAIIATAAPGLGAAFAILVMTADFLANMPNLQAALASSGIPGTGAAKTSKPTTTSKGTTTP